MLEKDWQSSLRQVEEHGPRGEVQRDCDGEPSGEGMIEATGEETREVGGLPRVEADKRTLPLHEERLVFVELVFVRCRAALARTSQCVTVRSPRNAWRSNFTKRLSSAEPLDSWWEEM
mmetsp:Transcript_39644/g.84555  ORF Transcript_39644/g.84555 Transcript_39644/m.84555 type:complete len:118 (+) Transcript_39644:433-786(+)